MSESTISSLHPFASQRTQRPFPTRSRPFWLFVNWHLAKYMPVLSSGEDVGSTSEARCGCIVKGEKMKCQGQSTQDKEVHMTSGRGARVCTTSPQSNALRRRLRMCRASFEAALFINISDELVAFALTLLQQNQLSIYFFHVGTCPTDHTHEATDLDLPLRQPYTQPAENRIVLLFGVAYINVQAKLLWSSLSRLLRRCQVVPQTLAMTASLFLLVQSEMAAHSLLLASKRLPP